MATRYEIIGIIHFDSFTEPGTRTLCHKLIEGSIIGKSYKGTETKSRVTCIDCIKIVNNCKKIAPFEIGKSK